jgi:hypothetical protein
VPFGQDGNYSHEAIVNRINAGPRERPRQPRQRSLSMIARNCGGRGARAGASLTQAGTRSILAQPTLCPSKGQGGDEGFRAPHRAAEIGRWCRGEPLLRRPGALGLRKSDPTAWNGALRDRRELRAVGIGQPFIPTPPASSRLLLAARRAQLAQSAGPAREAGVLSATEADLPALRRAEPQPPVGRRPRRATGSASMPLLRSMFATGSRTASRPSTTAGTRIDQMEKCGHYKHWRTDFELVRDLGISFLRFGPPIHRTYLGPGRYDWEFADLTFGYLKEHEILPIVDLCHFGVPDWIGNFQNPDFPELFADYARAFARRFPVGAALYAGQRDVHLRHVLGRLRLVERADDRR